MTLAVSFEPRPQARQADPTDRLRVVYVEDDERLARLTAQYLQTHGVEVQIVASGAARLGESWNESSRVSSWWTARRAA